MSARGSTWAVALVVVAAISVFGLESAKGGSNHQELLVMLTAFVSSVIVMMLKQDESSKKLDQISHQVNGELRQVIKDVVREEVLPIKEKLGELEKGVCK